MYKWGITGSPLCSFCGKENETLIHLFTECGEVVNLWENVYTMLQEHYKVTDLVLNPANIILNEVSSVKIANFMVLVAKQFIYRQKCLRESNSFPYLQSIC